jgi:hypothetical protein
MANKDWTGNNNSIYKTLGASNHTDEDREVNDYYATEPKAVELLLNIEYFDKSIPVWECACGEGHLSEALKGCGYEVLSTDLIDRGYGDGSIDFLSFNDTYNGNIITNPPYKYAKEFCEHAIEVVEDGCKIAMFLKLQFMEGKARKELFKKYLPMCIYVSSSRLLCAKNGDFNKMREGGGSAVAYAWYIWQKGYTGETVVRWFN